MAGFGIAIWGTGSPAGRVVACADDAALMRAWSEARGGAPRAEVGLVHVAGERIRRPTRWETSRERLLATPAAAEALRPRFAPHPLPDELDSDFLALVPDPPAGQGLAAGGPRLADAVDASLRALTASQEAAFRRRVGWGVEPVALVDELGEALGPAYQRALDIEKEAYRALDAASAWPRTLARRTAGVSPRRVHRLAAEPWAEGMPPEVLERLVGFVWAGTPGEARRRPDHWQRIVRIAEAAALAMPPGSPPDAVARAATGVLSPTSMRFAGHLLATMGLADAA